ncbi:hypothetical protein RvY_12194 [Ramazzottius varieornatus]|uniref:ZSWIM1/3 RNaseH-like domain-containing protein n=1 Tax=Ramazzottius varieornatus TaxID=947166 RepID=A0A1D1VP31_RAMVA|nr:hypothetical protein RvY_12194 [Ramazzottius varieornatus]
MCEDKNGVGQAAFVGLLSSEKKENLAFFFESFKDAHPEHWERVEVAFTDKDFHEIALLKRELPQARPLLCVFHVVKWMKTKIVRLPNVKEDRLRIYQLFNKALHCYNEDNFEKNRQDLIDDSAMTEEFRGYLQDNWWI